MKQMEKKSLAILALTALVLLVSVLGPEQLARYKDRGILNQIVVDETGSAGEGYRYTLNSNEKLYLLSECLNHQVLPESELSAMTRVPAPDVDYESLIGSYAFVVNRQGPSGKEITGEEIYEVCNREIGTLKECGVLPDDVREVAASSYSAVLYSAIDVLEPRNNIAVWKLSLSNSQENANKENRLIDAYLDANDGKMYEFYVRTPLLWEDIDTDAVIEKWGEYMGLGRPTAYESDNPLLETTPYFKKYVFPGMGEERTIVTVGFYEGINELFLKISR